MPPKGSRGSLVSLGNVSSHADGWRVRAKVGGISVYGPFRAQRRDADADLLRARAASSHEGYRAVLNELLEDARLGRDVADSGGGELASSGAGSSGLGIRRRGGGRGVVDDAAVAVAEPRSVARKRSAGVLGGAEDPGLGELVSSGAGSVVDAAVSVAGPSVVVRKRPACVLGGPDHRRLLLQLRRVHYDAIKAGRKVWEARPSYQLRKGGWCESSFSQLAAVGRVVVLQSGAGTNDLASVVEFRRYEDVKVMVGELGIGLLPDSPDSASRVKVYEELYSDVEQRNRGFIAMRLRIDGGGSVSV